jgi:sporulation protein YlmC with PRC-barrel domain
MQANDDHGSCRKFNNHDLVRLVLQFVPKKETKMNTKIQFQKNATVVSADGRQIGSLQRIVVNPKNNVLTNIVVRTTALLAPEEKVVPIDQVAEAGEDQIMLHDHTGTLETFPAFEEQRIIEANDRLDQHSSVDDMPLVMFGRPNIGVPYVATPVSTNPDEQFVTQFEQNIPIGTVEWKVS